MKNIIAGTLRNTETGERTPVYHRVKSIPQLCKECGTGQRENGSSRCAKCSESYRQFKFHQARLDRKISAAKNN